MSDPLSRESHFRSFCVAAGKVGLRPCCHRFKRLPAKGGYSFLPRQRGVPLDPWCGLSSLRDARASSQGFPGSRQGDGRTGRSSPRGHRNRSYSSSRLYRHSGWSGSGAANSGDRAEIPTQPALSDLQTWAVDRENAYDRGCRRELGACSTGHPSSASATSTAAGSFESGFPEPWPDSRGARVCTSEAHACGCKFFRGSIRRLRKRSGGSPSCYRKRQPAALNRCDVKRKKSFGEHVVHVVWHEGFEWHGLGMNVSLICACFGSLGNLEAPQSLQALIVFPSLLCLPSSRLSSNASYVYRRGCDHALRRAPLRLEPLEWYSFLVVFFGTSVFLEVVSKARFEDQKVSCEVPPKRELFSNEVEE